MKKKKYSIVYRVKGDNRVLTFVTDRKADFLLWRGILQAQDIVEILNQDKI